MFVFIEWWMMLFLYLLIGVRFLFVWYLFGLRGLCVGSGFVRFRFVVFGFRCCGMIWFLMCEFLSLCWLGLSRCCWGGIFCVWEWWWCVFEVLFVIMVVSSW